MNRCYGDKRCLNLCICECNEECVCGHREHNGICTYHYCECYCNTYNEKTHEYVDFECKCGHRSHNGICYLERSPCCEPIKCLNYIVCKSVFLYDHQMPNFPFCTKCFNDMGKFKYSDFIKKCNICNENKNILLLECNHEICNECWIFSIYYSPKNNSFNFNSNSNCPFCIECEQKENYI